MVVLLLDGMCMNGILNLWMVLVRLGWLEMIMVMLMLSCLCWVCYSSFIR